MKRFMSFGGLVTMGLILIGAAIGGALVSIPDAQAAYSSWRYNTGDLGGSTNCIQNRMDALDTLMDGITGGTGPISATTITASGAIVGASTLDVDSITTDAGAGLDVRSAGTLPIGAATATKIEIGLTAVETEVQGTLDVLEAADFDAAVTMGTTLGVTGAVTSSDATASSSKDTGAIVTEGGIGVEEDVYAGGQVVSGGEVTADGKYAVTGGDAATGLMVLKASITATSEAIQTNTFATVFGAAPVVTATYTEDPGDVRPIWIGTITASNVIVNITADKNYAYQATGTRP